MTKARDIANNAGQGGGGGNKNLIINGGMQICQRSTSATGIGTAVAYNTVDRWRFADASNPPARFTQTQSTDAPDGFGFSHKFEVTTADTSVASNDMQYTDHFIEAQNLQILKYGTSNAESFTLSFYVKCSVASTMGVRFTHEDGGGEYGATYTINSVNTWERKTITVSGNTATAINNDNGRGLRIAFGFTAGSDYAGTNSTAWGNGKVFGAHTNTFVGTSGATWQVTGVQLEVGDKSTDFEHIIFGDELKRCQRYYHRIEGASKLVGHCFYFGATEVDVEVNLPCSMRAAPTLTSSSGSNHFRIQHYGDDFNTLSGVQYYSGASLNMWAQSGGSVGTISGTGGDAGYVVTNSASSIVEFSSEL